MSTDKPNGRPKPPDGKALGKLLDVMLADEPEDDEFTRKVVPGLRRYVAILREKAAKWDERCEELLRLCHNAPMAVGMDTRSIDTAVRRLVDFAWECVQGESRDDPS